MTTYLAHLAQLALKPSAVAPLVMSALALALLIGWLTLVGVPAAPQPHGEGGAARLYQLLIVGQAPILVWFAVRWGLQDLKAGATVLAAQMAAIALSLGPLLVLDR